MLYLWAVVLDKGALINVIILIINKFMMSALKWPICGFKWLVLSRCTWTNGSEFRPLSPSSRRAPGSCGPSWSWAAAWVPLRWRSASWGRSSAGRTCPCLKNPCRTCRPRPDRCPWAWAEVGRMTRRKKMETHRSRSYWSDSLRSKRRSTLCYTLSHWNTSSQTSTEQLMAAAW